jgi:hypothetical protein
MQLLIGLVAGIVLTVVCGVLHRAEGESTVVG